MFVCNCKTFPLFYIKKTATYHVNRFGSVQFVPHHKPVSVNEIEQVTKFMENFSKTFVLTGAGISTESGIPDYRSAGVGLYARSTSRPVQFQEFLNSQATRKRYWARNYIGWPRFSSVLPNETHFALRDLEVTWKRIGCIVTQNVDGLHAKAGSQSVTELHGTAYQVICLNCNYRVHRHIFQNILHDLNPHMQHTETMIRPDGDVDLPQDKVENFVIPDCPNCMGILKPDIVFFGDNVPRDRVAKVNNQLDNSDSLLVLGSSLSVFSGFRIILRASELAKPIAIVNIGDTRGDKYAHLKINAKCSDIVPKLCSVRSNC